VRGMRVFLATTVFLALFSIVAAADSDEIGALRAENAALRERLDKVEKQMQDLLEMVQASKAASLTTDGKQCASKATQPVAVAGPCKGCPEGKKPILSSIDVDLYGFIKLDASYDTSRTNAGNFARWVESEGLSRDDDQFNMTAKQTRLGLNLKGPSGGEINTSGKIEIDFYGNGTENKPEPMLRHAYMTLDWPEHNISLLAGQTWDVISPLNPSTLNYSVNWWAGNIGYRRPQIRLTKRFDLENDVNVKFDIALARTIGRVSGFDPGDSGEDWKYPGIQTRLGFTVPFINDRPATFGISGHYHKEEFDTDASGHDKNFNSWSANLDATVPITDWLTVKGEAFSGSNLDAYLGGIGQGVNLTEFDEYHSRGGWLAFNLGPWGKWKGSLGASFEDLREEEITDAAVRKLNRVFFANTMYSINEKTSIGFELSNWFTQYYNLDDGNSTRFQTSFVYKF